MDVTRRVFMARAAAFTAGFLGLGARCLDSDSVVRDARGYGAPVPDPGRIVDLPADFTYTVISRRGDAMNDGFLVPGAPDGMAAFPGPDGLTILVRNHEQSPDSIAGSPFGPLNSLRDRLEADRLYDGGAGVWPGLGGTTTVLFDTRTGRLERQHLSLSGTYWNCSGGPTPWGTWITCEEDVTLAGGRAEKDHGWCFEVSASAEPGVVPPVPLRAMGRFNHEAAAVDVASGAVFLTEDRPEGLLYRFTPATPGRLADGGRLQALALRGRPAADTTNLDGAIARGTPLDVDWIDLHDIESPAADDLRTRGRAAGAAAFSRGEGMWSAGDGIYFTCTSGGAGGNGQVWRLRPGDNRLELFIEPNDAATLDRADNITVAPWGDLILCEDGPRRNRLIGVTPAGSTYVLAENAYNSSEFAGACFSPDGSTLFVNMQSAGLTLAIVGPW